MIFFLCFILDINNNNFYALFSIGVKRFYFYFNEKDFSVALESRNVQSIIFCSNDFNVFFILFYVTT